MWGIVLGNRGGIVRLLYYLIVGEAISLPMSLRNKTVQRDGRIVSSPTEIEKVLRKDNSLSARCFA